MRKLKWLFLVFFLFFIAAVQVGAQEIEAGPETPIKVTLKNSSDFTVQVHIMSYDMIAATYTLEPRRDMEIDVEYGNRILLEYPPRPHQTQLSEMGSLNELNRTVFLRNDGESLFIEEKFSGQRAKGQGEKRIPRAFISEPGLETPQNQIGPASPGNKKNQEVIDPNSPLERSRLQRLKDKDKKTRKEDPTQPENKTEKKKN